eukprot:365495-Chlamydomonas_euryale.AAC.4
MPSPPVPLQLRPPPQIRPLSIPSPFTPCPPNPSLFNSVPSQPVQSQLRPLSTPSPPNRHRFCHLHSCPGARRAWGATQVGGVWRCRAQRRHRGVYARVPWLRGWPGIW